MSWEVRQEELLSWAVAVPASSRWLRSSWLASLIAWSSSGAVLSRVPPMTLIDSLNEVSEKVAPERSVPLIVTLDGKVDRRRAHPRRVREEASRTREEVR
jgi:hypothetical protein